MMTRYSAVGGVSVARVTFRMVHSATRYAIVPAVVCALVLSSPARTVSAQEAPATTSTDDDESDTKASNEKKNEKGEPQDEASVARAMTAQTPSKTGKEKKPPPTITGIADAYTDSGTWAVGIGHSASRKMDKIRYSGVFGYADVKLPGDVAECRTDRWFGAEPYEAWRNHE